MKKSKTIYLDCAAATPVDKRVITVMKDALEEDFANPSAIHGAGVIIKKKLDKARGNIAKIFNAHADEIIFTSGATESNNLAIMGTLVDKKFENTALPHIITTNIEHPSVLEVFKHLEETKQAEVTFVGVEKNGIVDPEKIKKSLKLNTVLVSVMYANNEIGTIQPITEIAKEIRHYKKINHLKNFPFFHTDATQAINYLSINVERLGVDLLSFNGGKIYGPKGIGGLFLKRNTPLSKIIWGGHQELGFRPGTENIVNVLGLAEALRIVEKTKEKEVKRLTDLRDYFIKKLLGLKCLISINGDLKNRLPNNINISVPEIPSDLLLLELSARGIYVSERSACKSGEKGSSYVIDALKGVKIENRNVCTRESRENNSIRFSLGRHTTKVDIDYTLKSITEILQKLKKWYY